MRIVLALCIVLAAAGVASARPRITFTGNTTFSSKQLLAAMDDLFDARGALVQEAFERGLLLLYSYYWDRGYARVKIGEPTVTPTEIVIPITENEKFTFGAIAVTGDASPKTNARHLGGVKIKPGDQYTRTQIAETREKIARYYEERGHADVNVVPRAKTDVTARTVSVTFEITPGPVMYVEAVNLWCDRIPEAASLMQVFVHDRYDVRLLEGSKRAVMQRGGLTKDEVIISTKRGPSAGLIIINLECVD